MKRPFRVVAWHYLIIAIILAVSFKIFVKSENQYPTIPKPPVKKSEPIKPPPKSAQGAPLRSSGYQDFEDIVFPENFFFGTAYSDFQTAGLSSASDWSHNWNKLAYLSEKVFKKPAVFSGNANDLFNRYKEDFDLAGQIGIQVHRISLEWSRIEPEEGKWDMAAVNKWKEIFRYMKSRGIEPMICMNHFPIPQWFAEKGGWESPQAPYYYSRYAEFLAKKIGVPLKIKWWLTFNEPQFIISIPYQKGSWPPFKGVDGWTDSEGITRLMNVSSRLMDAHRLSYRAIHREMNKNMKETMVGFASAPGAFYPNDPRSDPDKMASNIFGTIYTLAFDSLIGNTDRDFIGLNYYGRVNLQLHIPNWRDPKSWLGNRPFDIQWDPTNRAQGQRPKEFYPQGLYDTIMKFKDMGKPIVVTENGISDEDDKFREEFMIIHLKAIHNAIRDGADVRGYQYWSLTDTWEPGDLAFSHFGLIAIDRNHNLKRSARPSALTYSEIIKTRTIRKELLEKHKELAP